MLQKKRGQPVSGQSRLWSFADWSKLSSVDLNALFDLSACSSFIALSNEAWTSGEISHELFLIVLKNGFFHNFFCYHLSVLSYWYWIQKPFPAMLFSSRNYLGLSYTNWECEYRIVWVPKYRRKVFCVNARMSLRHFYHRFPTNLDGIVKSPNLYFWGP